MQMSTKRENNTQVSEEKKKKRFFFFFSPHTLPESGRHNEKKMF
jgi:hypothetical protein